jgi:hypothetical protein
VHSYPSESKGEMTEREAALDAEARRGAFLTTIVVDVLRAGLRAAGLLLVLRAGMVDCRYTQS